MYAQELTAGQTHFRLSGCLIYHLSILRSITTVRNIIAKRSIAKEVLHIQLLQYRMEYPEKQAMHQVQMEPGIGKSP